jgi:hypothetical protein
MINHCPGKVDVQEILWVGKDSLVKEFTAIEGI